jgi:hypothetical protein
MMFLMFMIMSFVWVDGVFFSRGRRVVGIHALLVGKPTRGRLEPVGALLVAVALRQPMTEV